MDLADFLSEHGIITYCTGGRVVEYPGILGGQLMLESLSRFNIDIAFFASAAFDFEGNILSSKEHGVFYHRCFRNCSKKIVYLCGSDKFNGAGQFISINLEEVDFFISDGEIPDKLKQKYEKTVFIVTK